MGDNSLASYRVGSMRTTVQINLKMELLSFRLKS